MIITSTLKAVIIKKVNFMFFSPWNHHVIFKFSFFFLNNIYIYQKEDLQVVQTTLLATRTTALMMSLQLLPGQNLNWGCDLTKSRNDNWLYISRTLSMEMWAKTKSSAARVSQLADIQDKPVKQNYKCNFKNTIFLNSSFSPWNHL